MYGCVPIMAAWWIWLLMFGAGWIARGVTRELRGRVRRLVDCEGRK